MGCELPRNNVAEKIPENIFQCPECGVIDPEISKINVDNKKIEFYCKKCEEKEKEYESKNFAHEKKDQSTNYYLKPNGKDKENQFWFKEFKRNNVKSSTVKSLLKKIFQSKLENAKETIEETVSEAKQAADELENQAQDLKEKAEGNYRTDGTDILHDKAGSHTVQNRQRNNGHGVTG